MKWKKRGADHICKACWPSEAPEDSYVLCYSVNANPDTLKIPDEFWDHQRARRVLWDALVCLDDEALAKAQVLRAAAAPAEGGVAAAAQAAADLAWEAFRGAKGTPEEDTLHAAARSASAASVAAQAALKKAARAAGCDERPVWAARDEAFAEAPMWTYAVEDQEGRRTVVRAPSGWRLGRSNADDVIESYKRAWSAWIKQPLRRRPRVHGQALGDRLRTVLRYTNGQSIDALSRGTPSLALATVHPDRKGTGQIARLRMAFAPGSSPGDERAAVEGMVHVHRPIPTEPGAIRQVALIADRLADRWKWSLQVTVRTPRRYRSTSHTGRAGAVAIDLRWRISADEPDRILVAQWVDTAGESGQIHVDLAHCDRNNRKAGLPGAWRDLTTLQREIDGKIEAVKIAVWQRLHGAVPYSPEWQKTRARGLLRAVKREDHAAAKDLLISWESEYRRLWRRLGRLREQLLARRDQAYYEAAHAICARAKVIVLEAERGEEQAMDLRPLAQMGGWGQDQRQAISPSRIRTILTQVAPQHATQVALIEKYRTSTTCPECGDVVEPSPYLMRTCGNGHTWEQPTGACLELLRRWREQSSGAPPSSTARRAQGRGSAARLPTDSVACQGSA